jgi:hypothetical protein
LEELAEPLILARPLASGLQTQELSVLGSGVLTRQHALPHGVAAFSPVSLFPLLFASIWISRLF